MRIVEHLKSLNNKGAESVVGERIFLVGEKRYARKLVFPERDCFFFFFIIRKVFFNVSPAKSNINVCALARRKVKGKIYAVLVGIVVVKIVGIFGFYLFVSVIINRIRAVGHKSVRMLPARKQLYAVI